MHENGNTPKLRDLLAGWLAPRLAEFCFACRRWALTIVMATLCCALIGLGLVTVFGSRVGLVLPWASAGVDQAAGQATFPGDSGTAYDYTRMSTLMGEYTALVVGRSHDKPLSKRSRAKFSSLLRDMQDERTKFYAHLGGENYTGVFLASRRRSRAVHHYIRSLEDAITDLGQLVGDKIN